MASSVKLTNANGKVLTLSHEDTHNEDNVVDVLATAYTIATVNDFGSVPTGFKTVIVKDVDRGGTFIWSATGTANGGTVFAGLTGYWNRQYSGAVNVKWFGAIPNDTSIGATNYNAFISALSVANKGGSIFVPHYSDGNFSMYYISQTIDLSFYTGVTIIGESSELVFIRPADIFTGTTLIKSENTDGNIGWGNKLKNIVIQSKKPDLTKLDNIIYLNNTSIWSFDNVYFEESGVSSLYIKDSMSITLNGCTFEDGGTSHIRFENLCKSITIVNSSFNGGAPFSFTTESGFVECSNNTFNSLSGGIACNLMAFTGNVIRNPNGTTLAPIMLNRDSTHCIRNNKIYYTGTRTPNANCVVRIDNTALGIVRVSGNQHLYEDTTPMIQALNNFVNLDTPIKFEKSTSSSNYYFQYYDAVDNGTGTTNSVRGLASSSKYVRWYQDGRHSLTVPTNGTQYFYVGDNQSLVFDFIDVTFKVVDIDDITEYQAEIGTRYVTTFTFTCKQTFPHVAAFNTLGRLFAYDDRL